ncbi:biopolymer transporter ExbD [Halomonas sp. HP20-15]|uniref:ExbD/TolR family protein n=1 Tax=Halomonas sp. HP20-15 TaxID=3085901 RepID=UPI00298256C3|nr:biopolymer transporter ExbD [Halomonas sp. HP20-15]MDW5376917.1 biopolymer transporter ExbD [Halomonas sp. HP20-15]
MKFARRHREPAEVNLTPLIDVVFLLLIFFMVSTTFETREALELTLPASENGMPAKVSPVTVVVTRDGDYRLDGRTFEATGALRQALSERAAVAREQGLVIEADGQASHATVVGALDQAAALGIQRVRIATRTPSEPLNQAETP